MKRATYMCFVLALLLLALQKAQAETIFPARDLTENGEPISWVSMECRSPATFMLCRLTRREQ